jgi:hypothetical protein
MGFCGPHLFPSHLRHPVVFYHGVETPPGTIWCGTPASFSFRSIFLYRCAQAQAATAAAAPRGRTSKAQANAPQALTLAFRLRAVLRPEAPKGRPTAAQANGLGSKSSPLSFGASPEGAEHEFVAPFQGWVCQGRR